MTKSELTNIIADFVSDAEVIFIVNDEKEYPLESISLEIRPDTKENFVIFKIRR